MPPAFMASVKDFFFNIMPLFPDRGDVKNINLHVKTNKRKMDQDRQLSEIILASVSNINPQPDDTISK